MSRRRTRRIQEREEREAWESVATPEQRLVRSLVPYFGVLCFLGGLGLVTGDRGVTMPFLATAIFWGMGIASGYLRRKQQAAAVAALGTTQQEAPPIAAGAPAAAKVPAVPNPAPRLPPSLEPLAEEVRRVAAGLTRHGRGRVAETVERGLVEVARLAALAELATSGPDADALTEEIAGLRARAAASTDPEAAALWAQNAKAAERRLAKVMALAAAAERTHARIEAYRQTVKSLAVDLARLELVGEAAADLPAVDQHAAAVELEVEALTRTHAELARLEKGEGAAPALRSTADEAQDGEDDGDDGQARARRARVGRTA